MAADTDSNMGLCFDTYPAFRGEFEILLENGVITREPPDCYVWNYNLTSLAEYFAGLDTSSPGNRKWFPVEDAFRVRRKKGGPHEAIKKGSLRHLYSNNGREFKNEYISMDTEEILAILDPYRKRLDDEKKERAEHEENKRVLGEIKKLIAGTDDKKSADVKKLLKEIKNLLP
jgi:hypothetical protein